MPTVAVEGTGAVAVPVPPVATVYHNKPVPVAVRAVAVDPWQKITGLVAVGAGVDGSVVTVIDDLGLSQLFMVWLT